MQLLICLQWEQIEPPLAMWQNTEQMCDRGEHSGVLLTARWKSPFDSQLHSEEELGG